MTRLRPILLATALAALAAAPAARAAGDDARYALANDCFALQTAAGKATGPNGPYFMKPTDLGSYMLHGKDKALLAASESGVTTVTDPGPDADWIVTTAGGAFRLKPLGQEKVLAASGDGLTLEDPGSAGDRANFKFAKATGCAEFPEAATTATGTPSKGRFPFADVRGFVDAHMHLMAFEFLGGSAHCGKPWDRYGVTKALVDCPDHYPANGQAAALEQVLAKEPGQGHDPVGWPTFKDWPRWNSLTHESSYWKWLERAWRGGLRLYVNLLVDNGKLCDVYPIKRNPCDEMNTVRLELKDTLELQDYIDAQYGGPGKGWFRIVRDPFEARKVINDGKLAVVLGIENSRLFDCKEVNDVPQCDGATIDRQLDEFYAAGIRQMEIVNKFDNGLTGVAGDAGDTGLVVNGGQKLESNHFWDMRTCTQADKEISDNQQHTVFSHNDDALASAVLSLMPPGGQAPVYGPGPHCNQRGLTALGRYLIERMMDKRMVFDPDHMSVIARQQALDLLEAHRYPGVVSSHSWSTPDAYPRIYGLGGFIAPYAGSSTSFARAWEDLKKMRDDRYFWGVGYGADANGFGSQGAPRKDADKNPVKYPFKSFDGKVTLDKPQAGERTWDINAEGVAHYGLYPDWVEDLRQLKGDQIVKDMANAAEAYLQMWERTIGISAADCCSPHRKMTARGFSDVRLGDSYVATLERAGQPRTRKGRVWTWPMRAGGKTTRGRVVGVLSRGGKLGLIAVTGREVGVRRGARAVRGEGFTAVASRSARKRLGAYLKLAGLR